MDEFKAERYTDVFFLRAIQNRNVVKFPRAEGLPERHGNLATFVSERGELLAAFGKKLTVIRARPREVLATVDLPCPVMYIAAIPGRSDVVAVAHATAVEDAVRLYDTAALAEGSVKEVSRVKSTAWRDPSSLMVHADIRLTRASVRIAAVSASGAVVLLSPNGSGESRALHMEDSDHGKAVSVALGTRGRAAVGMNRGSVVLYVSTDREPQFIACIKSLISDWIPRELWYLDADSLLVVYRSSQGQGRNVMFPLEADGGPTSTDPKSFVHLGEVMYPTFQVDENGCLEDGTVKPVQTMVKVPGTDFAVLGSTVASDLELVGYQYGSTNNTEKENYWLNWKLNEGVSMVLPSYGDAAETFALGLAIDMTCQEPVPAAVKTEPALGPMPRLYCVTNEGQVVEYTMADDRAGAEGLPSGVSAESENGDAGKSETSATSGQETSGKEDEIDATLTAPNVPVGVFTTPAFDNVNATVGGASSSVEGVGGPGSSFGITGVGKSTDGGRKEAAESLFFHTAPETIPSARKVSPASNVSAGKFSFAAAAPPAVETSGVFEGSDSLSSSRDGSEEDDDDADDEHDNYAGRGQDDTDTDAQSSTGVFTSGSNMLELTSGIQGIASLGLASESMNMPPSFNAPENESERLRAMTPTLDEAMKTAEAANPMSQLRSVMLEMNEELGSINLVKLSMQGTLDAGSKQMDDHLNAISGDIRILRKETVKQIQEQDGFFDVAGEALNTVLAIARDTEEVTMLLRATGSRDSFKARGLSAEVRAIDATLDEKENDMAKALQSLEDTLERPLNSASRQERLRGGARSQGRRGDAWNAPEMPQQLFSSISLQGARIRRVLAMLDAMESQLTDHRRLLRGRNGADIGLSQARLEKLSLSGCGDGGSRDRLGLGSPSQSEHRSQTRAGTDEMPSDSSNCVNQSSQSSAKRLSPSVARVARDIAMRGGRERITVQTCRATSSFMGPAKSGAPKESPTAPGRPFSRDSFGASGLYASKTKINTSVLPKAPSTGFGTHGDGFTRSPVIEKKNSRPPIPESSQFAFNSSSRQNPDVTQDSSTKLPGVFPAMSENNGVLASVPKKMGGVSADSWKFSPVAWSGARAGPMATGAVPFGFMSNDGLNQGPIPYSATSRDSPGGNLNGIRPWKTASTVDPSVGRGSDSRSTSRASPLSATGLDDAAGFRDSGIASSDSESEDDEKSRSITALHQKNLPPSAFGNSSAFQGLSLAPFGSQEALEPRNARFAPPSYSTSIPPKASMASSGSEAEVALQKTSLQPSVSKCDFVSKKVGLLPVGSEVDGTQRGAFRIEGERSKPSARLAAMPPSGSEKDVVPSRAVLPPRGSEADVVPQAASRPPSGSEADVVPQAASMPPSGSEADVVPQAASMPPSGSEADVVPQAASMPPSGSEADVVPQAASMPPSGSEADVVPQTAGMPPSGSEKESVPQQAALPPAGSGTETVPKSGAASGFSFGVASSTSGLFGGPAQSGTTSFGSFNIGSTASGSGIASASPAAANPLESSPTAAGVIPTNTASNTGIGTPTTIGTSNLFGSAQKSSFGQAGVSAAFGNTGALSPSPFGSSAASAQSSMSFGSAAFGVQTTSGGGTNVGPSAAGAFGSGVGNRGGLFASASTNQSPGGNGDTFGASNVLGNAGVSSSPFATPAPALVVGAFGASSGPSGGSALNAGVTQASFGQASNVGFGHAAATQTGFGVQAVQGGGFGPSSFGAQAQPGFGQSSQLGIGQQTGSSSVFGTETNVGFGAQSQLGVSAAQSGFSAAQPPVFGQGGGGGAGSTTGFAALAGAASGTSFGAPSMLGSAAPLAPAASGLGGGGAASQQPSPFGQVAQGGATFGSFGAAQSQQQQPQGHMGQNPSPFSSSAFTQRRG